MDFYSIDENEAAAVNKMADVASKVYFFTNLAVSIVLSAVLLLMIFDTLLMLLFGQKFRALLMTAIDILLVYFMLIRRKEYKRKKSCKYIKNAFSAGQCKVLLSDGKLVISDISHSVKDIYAVFLIRDYVAFVLSDRTSVVIKSGEFKPSLYNWLNTYGLNIYTWDSDPDGKVLAKNSRLRPVKKSKIVLTLIFVLILIFIKTTAGIKTTSELAQTEPAVSFTFDIDEDIYSQMGDLYDYYEATHNFEQTNNIYYSYVNQAFNVLAKTSYIDGEATNNQELLVFDENNSCYIKYCKSENRNYSSLEITNADNTMVIEKFKNGCTVTNRENEHSYTEKDMYKLITEYDYICSEYPNQNYIKSYFFIGTVNIRLKSDKIFAKESAEYQMSEEGITFYTQSKEKEYKILLKDIRPDKIDDFLAMLETAYRNTNISSETFSGIIEEFEKLAEC